MRSALVVAVISCAFVCGVAAGFTGCSAANATHDTGGGVGGSGGVGPGGAPSSSASNGGMDVVDFDAGHPAPPSIDPSFNPMGPDPVVSISPDSVYETESSILAPCADPSVAVVWKAETAAKGTFIGYAFSTDGLTFGPPSALYSPGGRSAGAPTLASDSGVNYLLTWVGSGQDADGGVTDSHVYFATAPNGQTTFGPPVEVSDPADATMVYASPRVAYTVLLHPVVTYAFAGPTGRGIIAALSLDGGMTWTRTVVVSDPTSHLSYDLPYVGVDQFYQSLYVAYLERVIANDAIRVHLRSADPDGTTWSAANDKTISVPGEKVAYAAPNCIFNGTAQSPNSPVTPMAFVWVSYGLSDDPVDPAKAQTLYDIRIAASTNAGATFAAPASMLDPNAGILAMSPTFVGGSAGEMNLLYYASTSEFNLNGSLRYARAPTFMSLLEMPVTVAQPLVFQRSVADPRWIGDFMGASGCKDRFYASYVDNASGFSHVAVHRAKVTF